MPYVGKDWRSPEQKWVRTEGGWKPLSELHRALGAQIFRHFRSGVPSRSSRHSSTSGKSSPDRVSEEARRSKKGPHTGSKQGNHNSLEAKPTAAVAPGDCPSTINSSLTERDIRVKQFYFQLSMRCVKVVRSSSRQNNHYSTISDAVQKLNFYLALQDEKCFPFICKVLVLIYQDLYQSCSGSLQATLLRITESAKDIAIRNQQHNGLVLRMLDKALATNEKVRKAQVTGYGVRSVDNKIKSLLKMKRQLQDPQLQPGVGGMELMQLPDDCLYLIISHLPEPRDLLNLGLANFRLHCMTRESKVWRELTFHHYGNVTLHSEAVLPSESLSWQEIFIDQYKFSGGKLKREPSYAMYICRTCNCVFWKAYGHPCSGATPDTAAAEGLTPHQFMSLFPH